MSNLLSEVASPSFQSTNDDLRGFAGVGESHSESMLTESGGIAVECLDASLLQAISCLFPKDHGQTFITSLLQTAVIKQMDVAGIGRVDVAVAVLKSIEAFARQHGHGKDTALRYVDILEALQIVHRFRHADFTELLIPLVAWSPSEQALSALDALLAESAARAKLQQLAGTVKTRFLLLYGHPCAKSSLFDDLYETLSDIEDLLNKRLSPSKRVLLQLRLETLKARLETAGRKGDLESVLRGGLPSALTEKGDFYPHQSGRNRHDAAEKGDFQGARSHDLPPSRTEKGDFPAGENDTSEQVGAQKGDFYPGPGLAHQERDAEKGDFQGARSLRILAQRGDFRAVHGVPSLNVNESSHYDSALKDGVNDNDAGSPVPTTADRESYTKKEAAQIGRSLALFFENTLENTGGFVNKAKQCSPTTIRAAVIDTLVHAHFPKVDPADERGRPQKRAKWFHDACNKYAKPGACIPAFVEVWLRTDLSWQEIDNALREGAARYASSMVSEGGQAELVRQWLRGKLSQEALDAALASGGPPLIARGDYQRVHTLKTVPHIQEAESRSAKTWMDQDEAEVLAQRILREAAALGVTEAVARQQHGIYVVDLLWNKSRMTVKNLQEWTTHLASVQRTLALQEQYRREKAERGGPNGTAQ